MTSAAYAQQAPNAGSQLQQIQPAPTVTKSTPQIRIQQNEEPAIAVADNVKITVKSIRITGQTIYPEAQLVDLTGFTSGSELSLGELRKKASKITHFYHNNGYFLAQAYLPAQDIQDGAVTIAVIEGKYGKIDLRDQTQLSEDLKNDIIAGLNVGDTVAIAPLENRLLQFSDLPAINVKSTLIPGASIGTSDLIIDVTPGDRITGSIDFDNQGNRYTGSNRLGATVHVNEPFGHGDVATLRALTSFDGLNYARASYQTQIGRANVGIAYTSLDYELGHEFASLQASGTAQIASVYGSYPLIRSRSNKLSIQVNIDAKTFEDKVDSTLTLTPKNATVAMMSLSGDHRDNFGAGGVCNYSITWTSGSIDIGSAAALTADASTVKSNGHYDKIGVSASRIQNLSDATSVYAALNMQFASKNLDTSEKFGLGGANGVRAYPSGEANGDQGYLLNLEVRHVLPKLFDSVPGQFQLTGFIDTGAVTLNKNPWTSGTNRTTLSAAGVGLAWMDNNNFVVSSYIAHKLGNAIATSAPDAQTRFWLQGVKYF